MLFVPAYEINVKHIETKLRKQYAVKIKIK